MQRTSEPGSERSSPQGPRMPAALLIAFSVVGLPTVAPAQSDGLTAPTPEGAADGLPTDGEDGSTPVPSSSTPQGAAPAGSPVVPAGYESVPIAAGPMPVYTPIARPRPPRLRRVRFVEGMAVPEGAQVTERRRLWMILTGVAVFSVAYIAAVLDGIDRPSGGRLFVPLLGPILWQTEEGDADTAPVYVIDALLQTAGIVLFSLGMRKRRYLEYWALEGGRQLALSPELGPGYAGLRLRVW